MAQIVINEFSAANTSTTIVDNFGENEDWVELFNTTGSAVNLSGWHLSDRSANLSKWTFPTGSTIAANGYLRIWCSGRNTGTGTNMHTNFKITQTQNIEGIYLSNVGGTLIDGNDIDTPNQNNHSWGRSPNGSANWRVFTSPTPNASNTSTAYLGYATTPNITPASGAYSGSVSVGIVTPDPGITIRYTNNGDFPTAASTLYTAPFNVTQTRVIRAIAISSNPSILPSFVESNTYFINVAPHTCKIISLSGSGVATLFGGTNSTPNSGFELFNENFVKIDEGYGQTNKHGNDSWAYNQRGIDFIMRDQYGYDHAVQEQLFQSSPRDKFQRIILKPAANDNYPFSTGGAHIRDAFVHTLSERCHLNLDERKSEPCVVYLNGQYWGLYEIREKVDDNDYTDYYYNRDGDEIDYIKTWGGTWAEYGDMNQWNTLYNYIQSNNMAVSANYANVESQLDILSLMDYVIINVQTVCSDWLNYNTSWWHSNDNVVKWRYTLWDMDATFNHYINYTDIPSQQPTADPCDVDDPDVNDPEGHIELLNKLFENPDAYDLYVNRYADLNNTCFSCPFMLALLDSMVAEIQPEMPRQIARWGGSMATWNNNVQNLRNFILTRCTVIDQGIVDCYNVTGPYTITINIVGNGSVQVNTVIVTTSPWTGDYFGGNPIDLTAIPTGTGQFISWAINGMPIANPTDPNLNINLTGNITITATFTNCIPPATCDDNNCTTTDSYNTTTCTCENISITPPNCDDNNCTTTDSYNTTTCTCENIPITPPNCDDNNCTTTDSYNTTTCTCENIPITPPNCDDNNCTTTDSYNTTTCTCENIPITPPNCDDNNCTTTDSYNTTTCTCENIPITPPNCDDNNCTTTDSYNTTTCTCENIPITPPNCDDGNASTSDIYNEVSCSCEHLLLDFMLAIPSAFSPNGDGINDIFKPQGQNIISVQVEIYNRWGNKVYHEINTIPDMIGWDGTGQNGNCETGVYVYAITTQFVDGSETFYRGNITLIR